MISPKELKEAAQGITVLYVEDDRELRENTRRLLATFFTEIETAENGQEGLDKYNTGSYDLIITDINMPVMNGVKMVEQIRLTNSKQVIIVISAHDESRYLVELINLGVDNFVMKPLDIKQFLSALDKAIKMIRYAKMEEEYTRALEDTVEQRTRELSEALEVVQELSNEVVQRLTAAAELRDTDTGMHNNRLGIYAPRLAEVIGMPPDFVESIAFAAPLHDIGKIGIYDKILLKPGRLTDEEFEIMKMHTITGARILSNSKYDKIKMTENIAMTHHERWDGKGYPRGLKGEEIPIEGRIVAICDQYDALRSKRPYKPAFSHYKTIKIISEGDERTAPGGFDPRILAKFLEIALDFDEIFSANQD